MDFSSVGTISPQVLPGRVRPPCDGGGRAERGRSLAQRPRCAQGKLFPVKYPLYSLVGPVTIHDPWPFIHLTNEVEFNLSSDLSWNDWQKTLWQIDVYIFVNYVTNFRFASKCARWMKWGRDDGWRLLAGLFSVSWCDWQELTEYMRAGFDKSSHTCCATWCGRRASNSLHVSLIVPLAIVALVIYTLGFPSFVVYELWRHRSSLYDHNHPQFLLTNLRKFNLFPWT